MRLRVEGSALAYTAAQLRQSAPAAREVAAALRRIGRTTIDDAVDPHLRELTNFGADAFDLISADLDAVARALVSGGGLYRGVESALATAAGTGCR